MCLISKQKGVYAEFYAYEELSALPVYQLMRELQEFSKILKGELDWREAEVFTQYINPETRDAFPKFIMFSTHQETVAPLLGAFESMMLTDPGPASSVFFMFFKYQQDEFSEPEHRVKVSFNEQPWDLDSLQPLMFTES